MRLGARARVSLGSWARVAGIVAARPHGAAPTAQPWRARAKNGSSSAKARFSPASW